MFSGFPLLFKVFFFIDKLSVVLWQFMYFPCFHLAPIKNSHSLVTNSYQVTSSILECISYSVILCSLAQFQCIPLCAIAEWTNLSLYAYDCQRPHSGQEPGHSKSFGLSVTEPSSGRVAVLGFEKAQSWERTRSDPLATESPLSYHCSRYYNKPISFISIQVLLMSYHLGQLELSGNLIQQEQTTEQNQSDKGFKS